jgi:hypothetical protein
MRDFLNEFVIPVLIVCFGFFLLIAFCASVLAPLWWFSAKNEAILYNQRLGTKYTTSQFFWAGETIKSLLNEGKQTTQNLNINGAMPVRLEK